jgi:hypothetical protein
MKKKVLRELLKARGLKAELQPDKTAGEVKIKAIKPKRVKKEDK